MGFFEILLIGVVTLLVVGPERMPEAVRSTALTIGRIKRAFHQAREEVEKQVGADEIRMQLHNEEVMENLEKLKHKADPTFETEQHIRSSIDSTPDAPSSDARINPPNS